MIKDLEELKAFILFCKKEKVSEVSLDSISFKISDIALVENIQSMEEITKELSNLNSNTITDDLDDITKANLTKEEEEDLFWSSNT